jgi:hypothetical protein
MHDAGVEYWEKSKTITVYSSMMTHEVQITLTLKRQKIPSLSEHISTGSTAMYSKI